METRIPTSLVIPALLALVCFADIHAIEVKLTASDGAANDYFGYSVSVSGDYAIVGATWDDAQRGSAYIFKRDGATWNEHVKLTASDGMAGDLFGCYASISGDYAIVGARWDDSGLGAAYVFYRDQGAPDNWGQQAKLTASDGVPGDAFGASVAISGEYAVVGAPYGGKAYVFKRNNTSWNQHVKLARSGGMAGDYFGAHVSIAGDYAIVSAPYDDDNGWRSGVAYIFYRDEGDSDNWGQQARLVPGDGNENDIFGSRVSISGDYTVIGALWDDDNGTDSGSAYIFRREGTTWSQEAKLLAGDGTAYDQFGRGVAIEGDYVLIGADADGTGSVYSFLRSGASWLQQAKVIPSDGTTGDLFGWVVAISGDYAIIGAWKDDDNDQDSGSAYVYHCIDDLALPVTLSSFTAMSGDGQVILFWATESEVNNLGFHVYRALVEDGKYQRLTSEVIKGTGTSTQRHEYRYVDERLTNGVTYWYKLEDVDVDGTRTMHGPIVVLPQAKAEVIPEFYALHSCYPNPFNPITHIAYDLPKPSDVTLTLYALTGQKVAVVVDAHQEAGHHTARFDGSGYGNGVYLYRLKAGEFVKTRRMALIK